MMSYSNPIQSPIVKSLFAIFLPTPVTVLLNQNNPTNFLLTPKSSKAVEKKRLCCAIECQHPVIKWQNCTQTLHMYGWRSYRPLKKIWSFFLFVEHKKGKMRLKCHFQNTHNWSCCRKTFHCDISLPSTDTTHVKSIMKTNKPKLFLS